MLLFGCCVLCGAGCRRALCGGCRDDVAELAAAARCKRCAAIVGGGAEVCGGCLGKPPNYDRSHAALSYAPPLAAMIKAFKFGGKWQLAALLAGFARAPAADIMIPVPLFSAREKWRGFNQARELARALPPPAPPLADNMLERIRDTRPQSHMADAAARRGNVRGVFRAVGDFAGKTVLVVDDVMTTGATLDEIARVLKKAGAAAVVNLVVARTAPGESGA